MRKLVLAMVAVVALAGLAGLAAWTTAAEGDKSPEWSVNATVIEACSCPMFCQCYFNPEPAGHSGHGGHGGDTEHFCRFNMAFKINKGHYGDTKLTGQTFWIAGDLGSDFSEGKMDWAHLTFNESTTEAQRAGITAFIGSVFPVEWASFEAGEGTISWKAGDGAAHALLDDGKSAEIKLGSAPTAAKKGEPVVIKNLQYWWAKKNDGFILMPNEVEAWRKGDKAFEFGGGNGFMITIDADSSGS